MGSSEQNPPQQMLVAGPTTLNVGVAPEPPHEFVILLSVDDPDYGVINTSLGTASDLTEIIAGAVRSQNMLNEVEELCEQEGYHDVPSRMQALATVAARYPQVDDYPLLGD